MQKSKKIKIYIYVRIPVKSKKILTSMKSSRALMITCWLIYMIAYLTRNTYNASIVHLTGEGLLTTSLAGLVSTCYFVSYGCGHLINGFLADRTRPVVMLGAAILALAIRPWKRFIMQMEAEKQ